MIQIRQMNTPNLHSAPAFSSIRPSTHSPRILLLAPFQLNYTSELIQSLNPPLTLRRIQIRRNNQLNKTLIKINLHTP